MYSKLMNFWNSKYKNKIFNLNYEIFVQNFEENTKKILSFLDLRWENQLLEYQKTYRPVTTASHQQVRGKIKKNTSEKWKQYKNYLVDMQETLKKMNPSSMLKAGCHSFDSSTLVSYCDIDRPNRHVLGKNWKSI